MTGEMPKLSKNNLKELARLKSKKRRLEEGKVVVEGLRALAQLKEYGVKPLEQYVTSGAKPLWEGIPVFELQERELAQLCASEQPQGLAALYPLPVARRVDFRRAFYLDGISDPGNLGTIFRVAASFGVDALLLSPDCVEVSSPKVIRASLGSVFRVPFCTMEEKELAGLGARLVLTSAQQGSSLRDFSAPAGEKLLVILGSEARGISASLTAQADSFLRIEMCAGMESLNVAVAAGIIAWHLYTG